MSTTLLHTHLALAGTVFIFYNLVITLSSAGDGKLDRRRSSEEYCRIIPPATATGRLVNGSAQGKPGQAEQATVSIVLSPAPVAASSGWFHTSCVPNLRLIT